MKNNLVAAYPLKETWSPKLHNSAYKNLGIQTEMLAFSVESASKLIEKIREENIELTAVTMPHKQAVMPLLDEVDEAAEKIGAVNTIINRSGKLTGYNTDIIGIEYALRNIELKNKTVVLIGAGGAARAVAYALKNVGADLQIKNRREGPARELAETFGGTVIEEIPQNAYLIINATPLDNLQIPGQAELFDMDYTKNKFGLEMFVAQGLRQIELWSGQKLDPEKYIKLLSNEKD